MNISKINELQLGDIVNIQLRNKVDYGIIQQIDTEHNTACIKLPDREINIDSPDKWTMISLAPIYGELLKVIGFSAVASKNAYGNTSSHWVKNSYPYIWTLIHDHESLTWTLGLEQIGNILNKEFLSKTHIKYIHEMQHLMRTPRLMTN